MTDIKFNNEYITELKKKIINYVSRSNVNINKISFILSLYTNFIIDEKDNTKITVTNPRIEDDKIIPAEIKIGSGYFDIVKNEYFITPDYEDILSYKLIYHLIKGCSLNIKYEDKKVIDIIEDTTCFGYRDAFAKCVAEDIIDFTLPDTQDRYAFNKKIGRMLIAIVSDRYCVSSLFRHDDSFGMIVYSLSSNRRLLDQINKLMVLINQLINTLDNKEAEKTRTVIIKKHLNHYKHKLINLIICELYVPYINSVAFDSRRVTRDEILKGFLGPNYANLKLTDDNKDSYYWASLITNTIPINNKVSEQSLALLKTQIDDKNENNIHEIYVADKNYKTKNNIKEFFIFEENGKVIVKSMTKKDITEPHLVEEVLSYAYLKSVDKKELKKVEEGIMILASKGNRFKCSLKGNSLSNKMLVAGIVQLAKKNGYILTPIGNTSNKVIEFDVKKQK